MSPDRFNIFATVLLSGVVGLFGVVTGIALAMAFVARDEMKAADANYQTLMVYVRGLHADLRAAGFEPPPLPSQQEKDE